MRGGGGGGRGRKRDKGHHGVTRCLWKQFTLSGVSGGKDTKEEKAIKIKIKEGLNSVQQKHLMFQSIKE